MKNLKLIAKNILKASEEHSFINNNADKLTLSKLLSALYDKKMDAKKSCESINTYCKNFFEMKNF